VNELQPIVMGIEDEVINALKWISIGLAMAANS
jgi:hypothetical protein